jgi:hypothetical protein
MKVLPMGLRGDFIIFVLLEHKIALNKTKLFIRFFIVVGQKSLLYSTYLKLYLRRTLIMKKLVLLPLLLVFVLQGCCSSRSISANRDSSKVRCGISYWSEVSQNGGDGSEYFSKQ